MSLAMRILFELRLPQSHMRRKAPEGLRHTPKSTWTGDEIAERDQTFHLRHAYLTWIPPGDDSIFHKQTHQIQITLLVTMDIVKDENSLPNLGQ